MANAPTQHFTHDHQILSDGTIAFLCDSDREKWPWLALPPTDPIVVQTINFYGASEASLVRGTADPNKWTALTHTEWTCGAFGCGHATHGLAETYSDGAAERYRLTFFDAHGALVYRMSGAGVVFRTRNFESWRGETKQEIAPRRPSEEFDYAPCASVGRASGAEALVSPLRPDGTSVEALVTAANGFPPGHPYHSGSGDHVNATHLADIGQQFAYLVSGGKFAICKGGELTFLKYVELGRSCHLVLDRDATSDAEIAMSVIQADRTCATMILRY